MWSKNTDNGRWYKKVDVLEKDKYDSLKQDIEKVRLYSKCLSGSTYVAIDSLTNIYGILDKRDEYNWYIGQDGSTYSISATPSFPKSIQDSTKNEYYDKFVYEYGQTLKNKFTPVKLINDSIENYLEVDVATTEPLLNIGTYQPGLVIDTVILKEGHRVLVKDQKTFVTLSSSIDPNAYFTHSYFIEQDDITSIKYSYYNSENGIYGYTASSLVRLDDLLTYNDSYRYSVSVKLGDVNTQNKYHLNRLKNAYYPLYTNGDSMEFIEKNNWVLRNRVDYNNIYEISYYDIFKHATQSYFDNGYTYNIPERVISIGEFGMIVNHQNDISNIINNKFKLNLRSICETTKYYWICGDEGTILRVSKLDFEIKRIDIDEFSNFMSIDFFDDLRAFVVGKFNSIYYTEDGGYKWTKIVKNELDPYSYNKVVYNDIHKAYIGGESGVFIQVEYINNEWIFYKRKISKYLDINEPTEEYLLVDDINDMFLTSFTSSIWNLTYSTATQSVVPSNQDVLFIVANGGNILIFDTNDFIPSYDFLYIAFTQSKSDINSITRISGSSSVYIAADKVYSIDISEFNLIDPISNNIVSSTTHSVIVAYDNYVNKLFDYQGQNLYLCGNNSTLYSSGYTSSIYDVDSNFNDRYDSKLLFLDYEVGSKLNFFDDSQTYRLPDSITFSESELGNYLEVSNKSNEYNWLNYYKDVEKTFEYYTTMSSNNQVVFSTTFSYAENAYFSFTASSINISVDAIRNLAPNVGEIGPTQGWAFSKFVSGTGSIISTTYSESVFIYKYLIIFKKDALYPVDQGDVLYMESEVISTTLLVNKKLSIGFDVYLYCYIDFNQTIVNELKNYSGTISVTNLNKFAFIGSTASNSIVINLIDDTWNYDNTINPDDYFAYSPLLSDSGDLLLNFNLHPISNGYKLEYNGGSSYTLSAKFNNKTAYYNMQSKVRIDAGTYSMDYTDAFLKFGYKPTYNIYDYLNNINTVFNSSKRFLAMPRYASLKGNSAGTFTASNIYIDTNDVYGYTNKLMFGSDLKFEWDSIWINTFIDVVLYNSSTPYTSERMLVTKKYYDSTNNGYVIEFHKKLTYITGTPIDYIDILSRNTLQEISDDLQLMNNIHRDTLNGGMVSEIQTGQTFKNLENELTSKFPTDSYSKILLSDRDVKKNLSGVIFIDDKNELTLNIIKLEEEFDIPVLSTGRYTTSSTDYLLITCSQSHNLSVGDGIVLSFNGGAYSSNTLNQGYFGYQVVKGLVGTQSFYTHRTFDGVDIPFSDPGNISFIKRDPFLNYQPIDIMEVGVDKQPKRAVEIKPENILLNGASYSLINLDFNKYRYELVDGISVIDIYNKYPWVLEGEISNAVMGEDVNGLVWYMGDWRCGRWFGGTWISGRWMSGDWYKGTWNSYNTKYKLLNVDVNKNVNDQSASKWYGGRWFDGTWNNGIWYNGRRYAGDWNNGTWYNGIWNDGTWNGGEFKGGIWVLGTWNDGIFNCDNKPSYWIDGSWYGGDFENGMWYNGQFLEKNDKISRFGTKAFNTRTATWHAGKFSGGEFHSYLNIDDVTGETIASEFNKYSIWNTGIWNGGDWYGGVAYAINFNSATWFGGIIEEIQIIGLEIAQGELSKLILNGNFKFNINDEIWVVNDNNPTPYSLVGTNDNPGNYRVLLMEEVGQKTIVTINRDLYSTTGTISVDDIETGLRLTTIFKNSTWKSGVWTNGIFDGGYFEGGIWYGGLFGNDSNWGR